MLFLLKKLYRKYKIRNNIQNATKLGMVVGESFVCGSGVEFGSEPYLIEIGNHVQLSGNVLFITHDGGTWVFRDKISQNSKITKYGPIKICDNCFIGNRAIILPGVKIGKNSIIGAGAVVTKTVPEETIAVGNPAKPIMTYEEYVNKCIYSEQKVDPSNKRAILKKLFQNHNY